MESKLQWSPSCFNASKQRAPSFLLTEGWRLLGCGLGGGGLLQLRSRGCEQSGRGRALVLDSSASRSLQARALGGRGPSWWGWSWPQPKETDRRLGALSRQSGQNRDSNWNLHTLRNLTWTWKTIHFPQIALSMKKGNWKSVRSLFVESGGRCPGFTPWVTVLTSLQVQLVVRTDRCVAKTRSPSTWASYQWYIVGFLGETEREKVETVIF